MVSAGAMPGWKFLFCALVCSGLVCGCSAKQAKPFSGAQATQQSGGLQVSVQVPKKAYRVGEHMAVTVTATNISKRPVEIIAEGQDLVQLRIYKRIDVGWEQVQQYPQLATPVRTPWKLAPNQQRVWQLLVPVEPSWPTDQQLKLKASLNNWPNAQPSVMFRLNAAKSKPR
jgi:hypothetical protein